MENAAEALKLAGFTLLFVIALSVAMMTIMQAKRTSEQIITYSDKTKMSRNLRQLITKLERYINFLKDNEKFKTRFFEIGDGVAISRRRKKKDE